MSMKYYFDGRGIGKHVLKYGRDLYSFDIRTKVLLGKSEIGSISASDILKMRSVVLFSFITDSETSYVHCSKWDSNGALESETVLSDLEVLPFVKSITSLKGFLFEGKFHISKQITQFFYVVEV